MHLFEKYDLYGYSIVFHKIVAHFSNSIDKIITSHAKMICVQQQMRFSFFVNPSVFVDKLMYSATPFIIDRTFIVLIKAFFNVYIVNILIVVTSKNDNRKRLEEISP